MLQFWSNPMIYNFFIGPYVSLFAFSSRYDLSLPFVDLLVDQTTKYLNRCYDFIQRVRNYAFYPPRNNNSNACVEKFLDELSPIIAYSCRNNYNTVITGDTNLDLLKIDEREKFQAYFDLFVTNTHDTQINRMLMLRINAILNVSNGSSMAMSRRCCFSMLLRLYVSCCISNFYGISTYTRYWTPNISAQTKFAEFTLLAYGYHLLP